MRLRNMLTTAASLTLLTTMVACGAVSGGDSSDTSRPLTVMADVIPHVELIRHAQELGLLGDVKVDVAEISGGVDPNQLANAGDIDANFFQHVPYLNDWNANNAGSDLVVAATVHVEPLGLYSKKVNSLSDVPDSPTIAIPADVTNQARALFLLEDAGLLKLNVDRSDANLDYSQITTGNVSDNPKNISFVQIERPQLPASLDDPKVTLSVVNGSNALEAGLIPLTDSLILEKAENNPYANVLVTKESRKDDPRVQKLAEALTSPELQKFIEDNYQGSVLPASNG